MLNKRTLRFMLTFIVHTVVAFLVITVPTVTAQIVIAPRVQQGRVHQVQHSFELNQVIRLDQLDYKTTQKQTKVTLHKTSQPGVDGSMTETETILSLQNETRLPGDIRFSYDSAKNKVSVPLFDALKNSIIKTVFDKSGRISDVTIESTFDILPPEVQALVVTELYPTTVKKHRQQELSQYRLKPVTAGDTWQQQISIPLGMDSQFLFKTTHKYTGTVEHQKKSYHQVTITFNECVFSRGMETYSTGSPMMIKQASKSYLFDDNMGMIAKSDLSLSLTGDIKLKSQKSEATANLTVTLKRNWLIP